MDKILLSTKKRLLLPVVFLIGVALWLFLCHEQYNSYWFGTIYKVQTTDFNLLHHTLPSTLSQLIIADRDDLVQNVLDSNYGLFGLVVTDPADETVLYETSKNYHGKSWKGHIGSDELSSIRKGEPFDVLTDPPPLGSEWEHSSPRAEKASHSSSVKGKQAKVLGHLYYVRPDPPPFWSDLSSFVSTGLFESSGAKRGYLYITLTTMAFTGFMVLLFWLRQRGLEMKQGQFEFIQRELEIRKKALENLASELSAQKQRKAWLEKEAEMSYERALSLKRALEKLKDAMSLAGVATASQLPAGNGLSAAEGLFKTRTFHPPSALLEEIELLIPALNDNAVTLKSQASLLNDYCSTLEQRQSEMKRIVDQAYVRATRSSAQAAVESILDMTP